MLERTLDLGCGTGSAIPMLRGREFDVVGIDLSSRMIAVAKQRYADDRGIEVSGARFMVAIQLFGVVERARHRRGVRVDAVVDGRWWPGSSRMPRAMLWIAWQRQRSLGAMLNRR